MQLWPQEWAAPVLGSAPAVPGGDYGVQLAHDGDLHLGFFALAGCNDAGDGGAVLIFIAQFFKYLFDFGRGLDLFKTQFRLSEDGITQGDDLIPVLVNGCKSPLLQFLAGNWHGIPPLVLRGPGKR